MNLNTSKHGNRIQDGSTTFNVTYLLKIFLEVLLLFVKVSLIICEAIFRWIVPKPEKSVKGEVVLITGAGHGIGKELALQYADLDATVVCWDINEHANKGTVSQIKKKGKIAYGYTCDVTRRDLVMKTIKRVENEVGNVSILINNAGILIGRSFRVHDERDIQGTIDINFTSHFWILQSVLPSMIKNNHGHIVALSSYAGLNGLRNLVPYCSSKYAVRGIMSALREELRSNPHNQIQLTTIFPYIVDTGLCKTHVIRFPRIFKEIIPKDAAQYIIKAQRRNIIESTIPKHLSLISSFLNTIPVKVANSILDFVGIYFQSDK